MRGIAAKFSIFLVLAAVFSVSGYLAQFSIPFKIESLLDKNDRLRVDYETHQRNFSDERVILLGIESDHELSEQTINEVGAFWRKSFDQIRGLGHFQFLTESEFIGYKNQRIHFTPFIKNAALSSGAKSRLASPLYKYLYLSKDKLALNGSVVLAKSVSGAQEKRIFSELFGQARDFENAFNKQGLRVHFLGHKVAKFHFLSDMLKNQKVISPLIFLILSLLIFYLFKSMIVVFWVDLMIGLSYALVMCLIFAIDGGLNPYSALSLTFVIIVATSDLIHYFSAFLSSKGSIEEKVASAKQKLWTPCLLTTLTTAAGFFALIINDMAPVRFFGLYCGLGALGAFIVTFYFLPICLIHFPRSYKLIEPGHSWLSRSLFPKILKFKKTIILGFAALFVLLGFFSTRANIDDDFYGKFVDNHPLSKAFTFFDKKFNFISSIDISYPEITFPLSDGQRNELHVFEKRLASLAGVKKVSSYLSLETHLKTFSPELAKNEEKLAATTRFLYEMGGLGEYFGKEHSKMKSTLYLSTTSIVGVRNLVREIRSLGLNGPSYKIEGFINIRSALFKAIIGNFLKSFLFSFVAIFLIFTLVFKKFSWSVVAMLPNILPLILITSLMALMGIKIEGNAVMLVCIVIGVAVDDTIHFLYSVKQSIGRGLLLTDSILQGYRETSSALIGTTLVFVCSFPCFLMSDLRLMVQMGIFIILALVCALVADFLLLPALLLLKSD